MIGGLANLPLDVYQAYGAGVGPEAGGVAQLVSFSTATDGGTILVRVVPEPASIALLAALPLALRAARRKAGTA